ncbi:hypothetical protein FNF31_03292 [Cafeteria roenbergensis]|uniref:Uncharacterized protein n=1 Tax=Cafeteria roenbergensis TaxID=33653 RepID=A0A5A8DDE8_CAFRO|nr:hypothetical protein FNF31_03292 [Cafeteria roenbergensis]
MYERFVHNSRVIYHSPRPHKAFIATVTLQSVWLVVSRIILIVQVSMDPLRSVDELQWWYLALMVLTGWFVQSFAFEAVANANACELGAFVVVSIFLVIRDALGAFSSNADCESLSLQSECVAFLAVTCAFKRVYWALSLLMFTDLRWIKYKALGTDRELRAMHVRFEFFSAVKKLDVQFSLVVLATGLVFFHRTELETVELLLVHLRKLVRAYKKRQQHVELLRTALQAKTDALNAQRIRLNEARLSSEGAQRDLRAAEEAISSLEFSRDNLIKRVDTLREELRKSRRARSARQPSPSTRSSRA